MGRSLGEAPEETGPGLLAEVATQDPIPLTLLTELSFHRRQQLPRLKHYISQSPL